MRKILLIIAVVCFQQISGQTNFTAGNLVIYRVGTGSAALSSAGTAIFLDEYDGSGTLVQSVALPTSTSGSNSLICASGTATSEGLLTRSPNGLYLTFTGYAAATGTTSIAGTASATVPRVVGIIDYQKNINTSTALTDFSTGNNIRSALYNGTNLWVAGTTGISITSLGATTITTALNAVNNRSLGIFGDQLYGSSSSSTYRINTIGSGLPTTSGQTTTILSGLTTTNPASPYQFQMFDMDATVSGVDVMYVADDNTTSGGVIKYSLVSGTWVKNGTLGTAADQYRGLTGVLDGGTVTLYATCATTTTSKLIKVVDATGYNVTPTATASTIATAITNTAFRGVAFAPVQSSALPLNFIHFTSKNSGNQALLNWEMAADDNCKYFIVERSTNGKDFDAIANIKAERNKTVYGYRETYLAEGLAYYRIIGVEESGEKTYSSTHFVQFKVKQNFVSYPNPVTNGELTLSLADYGVKDITIFNSFGQPVKSAYFCNTSTKINISQLPKGMYYIQLKLNNVLQPIKTIIIQ
jgi:hypothetical protein